MQLIWREKTVKMANMQILLRWFFSKKPSARKMFFGAAASEPLTDAQLRDWAFELHARSIDPAKLPGFGIDLAKLLAAQSDDQALAEVRRWSGISEPIPNVLENAPGTDKPRPKNRGRGRAPSGVETRFPDPRLDLTPRSFTSRFGY